MRSIKHYLLYFLFLVNSENAAYAATIAHFQFTGSSPTSSDPGTNWTTSDVGVATSLELYRR